MDMLYAAQNSLRWYILQKFWVFMTTWQCHENYRICHDIYARSYIHAAKISSHTGYTSKQKGCLIPTYITIGAYFITQTGYISMHTRDVQQHKGTYFIPTANTSWITGSIQHVLAYFIIIAKSISSLTNISNLLHNMSYFIIIAYFNTIVTTKKDGQQ